MKIGRLIFVFFVGVVIAGCGSSGQEIDKDASAKAVVNAQMARQIFDAAGGKFEAVSETDRAKLREAYAGDEGVKKLWESMTNPPVGGGGPAGAPVPNTAGTITPGQ